MVVLDVLLGLNLLVLTVCVLRGQPQRRGRYSWVHARTVEPRRKALNEAGDALILPFRHRAVSADLRRAMSIHPSASDG